jgi:mono/diheme cytochrome c family protein
MRQLSMIMAVAGIATLGACERNASAPPAEPAEAADKAAGTMPAVEESTPTDVAAAPAPIPTDAASIARGRLLMQANCTRCHATKAGEPSAHASAPSFATLFGAYPPEYLQEAFAEGVFVGHGDMPAFEFAPEDIAALVAYLKTLEAPQVAPEAVANEITTAAGALQQPVQP